GHGGNVHADGTVAGAAGENGDAALVPGCEDGAVVQFQFLAALADVFAEQVVKFIRAHRALEFGAPNDFADEGVGVEQHVVVKEHVVNADDAFTVQFHV